MPTYVPLRRVRLSGDGYIRRPAWNWGSYRGVGEPLYQLEYVNPQGKVRYMEFRAVNRAGAVLQARRFLATNGPGQDVRS